MAKHNSLIDINSILNEYSNDIQEGITKAAIEVAENGKNELKVTSPKRTPHGGKYAKGWRVDKRSGKGYVHTTIYNATDWQLTHLLEKGHDWVGRDGKRKKNAAKPIKHIEPVEKKCIEAYKKNVEQVIKNGGL